MRFCGWLCKFEAYVRHQKECLVPVLVIVRLAVAMLVVNILQKAALPISLACDAASDDVTDAYCRICINYIVIVFGKRLAHCCV